MPGCAETDVTAQIQNIRELVHEFNAAAENDIARASRKARVLARRDGALRLRGHGPRLRRRAGDFKRWTSFLVRGNDFPFKSETVHFDPRLGNPTGVY